MLILVCTNIQKDFLLTSNNYLCYLIRRLWGAPWPVLNLLNLLGAHCPYLPKGQSKLGLKLGRKKREGLALTITWWNRAKLEESWQMKPTKGAGAGSVGQGNFFTYN